MCLIKPKNFLSYLIFTHTFKIFILRNKTIYHIKFHTHQLCPNPIDLIKCLLKFPFVLIKFICISLHYSYL